MAHLAIPARREAACGTKLAAAHRASTAFCRKWAKTCPGAVKSLEEAGAYLLTMYRYPRSQWKSLRTITCIERLSLEFGLRVKTHRSLPGELAMLPLLYGLVVSGQIRFRTLEGWWDMALALTPPTPLTPVEEVTYTHATPTTRPLFPHTAGHHRTWRTRETGAMPQIRAKAFIAAVLGESGSPRTQLSA